MTKVRTIKIDQREWDFREIYAEPLSLPDATVWEYARSCDKRRAAIVELLNSKERGKTIQAHIDGGLFRKDNISKAVAAFRRKLRRRIVATAGDFPLAELLMKSPHRFPEPWTAVKVRYAKNSKFRRAHLFPMSFVSRGLQENNMDLGWFNAVYPDGRSFHLRIDWDGGYTLKDILRDVEIQLRVEAKKHPDLLRGKASQQPIEPLKWLAAYRLKLAGHTYESAWKLLLPSRDYRIVPVFEDKSGWSDAVSRARKQIAKMEAGDPRASWLLLMTSSA